MVRSHPRWEQAKRRSVSGVAHRGWRGPGVATARLLHAALVVAFLGAWLTAPWEALRAWHIACGHALAVAWLLRVGWSLARPQASLGLWWRVLLRAGRRLRSRGAGPLRPATVSLLGLSGVVCAMLVLVPACFASGWVLGRLVEPTGGAIGLHRWLGTMLMVAAAAHVGLTAVLGLLRGRAGASGAPDER